MFTQILFSQALGRKGRGCCECACYCYFTTGWRSQERVPWGIVFKLDLEDQCEFIKQIGRRKAFQPEGKFSQFQCRKRGALFGIFFKIFCLLI